LSASVLNLAEGFDDVKEEKRMDENGRGVRSGIR
jgi:hypothetical protein